jgi:hypothetical protein
MKIEKIHSWSLNFIMVKSFFDGNKDILEGTSYSVTLFLVFQNIHSRFLCDFFLHMKNLTDSCKTKVKHTSMS